MCCLMHTIIPSEVIVKRRDSPWCSWFDWLLIAPHHPVNNYMVLCKGKMSHTSKCSSTYLEGKNTERCEMPIGCDKALSKNCVLTGFNVNSHILDYYFGLQLKLTFLYLAVFILPL